LRLGEYVSAQAASHRKEFNSREMKKGLTRMLSRRDLVLGIVGFSPWWRTHNNSKVRKGNQVYKENLLRRALYYAETLCTWPNSGGARYLKRKRIGLESLEPKRSSSYPK